MLPLLLAGAKSLTKKENPEPKKIKADSLLNREKSSNVDSSDIKKSSAIVLRPSSSITTRRISTESFIPKKEENVLGGESENKRIGFQDFIQELESINKTLDSIKEVLKKQISNKESENAKKRISADKLRKKQKESELEKKKPKGKKGELIKKPSISFLDAVINFLTNVFLGTLSVFALENLPKIIGSFEDITKNWNIWTTIKFGILALTNGFRRSLRFFLKVSGKLLSGPAKLIGKTIKFAANKVGSLLKSLGSKVVNVIKDPLKRVLGQGVSGALGGAARGIGSIFRRGLPRALPRAAAAIAGRGGAQMAARLGLLSAKGLKHFKRVAGIFKRIPVVGALIAMGIDLALGVAPDEALVGAIGGSIGAAIGGGIGSLILPVLGTGAGAFVGGFAGDWLAKELWKGLRPMIADLLPKEENDDQPVQQAEGGPAGTRSQTRPSSSPSTAVRPSGGTNRRGGSGSGNIQLTGHAKARIGNDSEFLRLVRLYSSKLRINPADLLGLMASESGLNPASGSSHVGLIQFSASSAASVGTSQSALRRMSRAEQMPYVYKYLKPKLTGIPGAITPGHLYTSVFLPAFVKEAANFVVASSSGTLPVGYPESRSWYRSNRGLDLNKDGKITIAELGKRIADKRREFGILGGTVVTGGDFGPEPSIAGSTGVDSDSFFNQMTPEEPPELYLADIRGAANQNFADQKSNAIPSTSSSTPSTTMATAARSTSASVSAARPASAVAPSVSAEPSYQQPQNLVVPIPIPQQQAPQQTSSSGRATLLPIGSGLNRGDAYREVLNVSLYKR